MTVEVHIECRDLRIDGQCVDGFEVDVLRIPIVRVLNQPDAIADAAKTEVIGTTGDNVLGFGPFGRAMTFDAGALHGMHRIERHQLQKVRRGIFEIDLQGVIVDRMNADSIEVDQHEQAFLRVTDVAAREDALAAVDTDMVCPSLPPLGVSLLAVFVRDVVGEFGFGRLVDAEQLAKQNGAARKQLRKPARVFGAVIEFNLDRIPRLDLRGVVLLRVLDVIELIGVLAGGFGMEEPSPAPNEIVGCDRTAVAPLAIFTQMERVGFEVVRQLVPLSDRRHRFEGFRMFAVQPFEQGVDDASFRLAGDECGIDALDFRFVDKRKVGRGQRTEGKRIDHRRGAGGDRDIRKGVAC